MEKEIITSNTKEKALIISQSKIDSVKVKDITKKGLRIYEDGLIGVSGGVGDVSEEELTLGAKENLKNKITYPCELSENINMFLDASKESIDDNYFLTEGEELLEALSKKNNDFIFSNKIRLTENYTSLSNSRNLNLEYRDRVVAAEIFFKEKSSVNVVDGLFGYTGRGYDRKEFIDFSNSILEGYRNLVKFPEKKKLPVAVSFFGDGDMFLKKFLKDLEVRKFMSGGSLFSDKLEKKVFSKEFTLYQTKNPKDVYLEPFFDMEGVINEGHVYPLIEEGIIKSPYTDKRTALEFKLKNTGAAASEYDGVPQVNWPSLSIKAGQKSIKELFAGDLGILLYMVGGGDFTSAGEFSTPVQLAFLYDGERILGRLPELQVSSNVYQMFNEDFRGVSSDSIFKYSNQNLLVMELKVDKI